MNTTAQRLGGYSAVLVGILSILYAILYLIVSRNAPEIGINGSWIVLAVSGIFSSAAFVALYGQTREMSPGFALWAVLLGVFASMATLAHGGYESGLIRAAAQGDPALQTQVGLLQQAPSQIDPSGLFAFLVTGIATFVFSYLIEQNRKFPQALGYLGMLNGVVLVILYFATANQIQTLILVSGGLTSVILGPIWWIWLGLVLVRQASNS
jgi:hypothetical protein